MSSILDALKKSEAERQRGQPPTIGSSLPSFRRKPPARRFPAWILPALALAAAVAAWHFGLFGGDGSNGESAPPPAVAAGDAPSSSAGEPTADTGRAPAVNPPAADSAIAAARTNGADSATASTPAAGQPPAERPATPARIGFGPYRPRSATPAAQAAPQPETLADADPPTKPAPPAAPPDAQAATAASADPAPGPETPAAVAQTAGPEPAPVAPPPDDVKSAEDAAPDGVPTFNELSFAARKSLPPITVTMHVYSRDPARRFALVNGFRARDGESIEGGVEIIRILPEGVQMRVADTEFILPVGN